MNQVLLDTHVWAWSLTDDTRLSSRAFATVEAAQTVSISAISLYEIGQKVRIGKWPEMVPHYPNLIELAQDQGLHIRPLTANESLVAAVLSWEHRDPFDRIIGATAVLNGLLLISADTVFDELADNQNWPGRLW